MYSKKAFNYMNPTLIGIFKEIGGEEYPSIRELLSEKPIQVKGKVLWYLKNVPIMAVSPGRMNQDVFSGKNILSSLVIHSDGIYSWCGETIYYFEKYDLILPEDFIRHVLFQLPDLLREKKKALKARSVKNDD